MAKRTRKAKAIKMYLAERTRYEPTSLEVIMSRSEHVKMDSDGDVTGITDVGLLQAKIQRVFNILENRHMTSFLDLLEYQFKDSYKYNTHRVKTFLRKESKIVKAEEQARTLSNYEEYKKLSPDEVSDILSRYAKNHFEENVRAFEIVRTDTISKVLNVQEMDMLQKEQIKNQNTLEYIKLCIRDGVHLQAVITKDNRYTFTENTVLSNPKEYGFRRTNHLYKLNKIMSIVLQKYRKDSCDN